MRFHDWEIRLSDYILEERGKPFKYGETDCALFACGAALVMTGVDLAADFRGRYDSDLSAARAIIAFTNGGTFEDLAAKVAEQFGLEEVKPLFAQRGDIVLVPNDARKALAIVDLDGWNVIGPGPRSYELSDVVRAWRV
jgi:uncharacterized protein DUF6950